MNVFMGLETIPEPFAESTVAIGTFDGVHRGHQAIIQTAIASAHQNRRPAIVFTFDRHPAELLAPERVPPYLTTPTQRLALISALGADAVVMARFESSLAELSPNAFIQTVLKDLLGAKEIVVGTNFLFGKERAGDVTLLERCQEQYGYHLHALEPIVIGDAIASSTRIRDSILEGAVAEAEEILGHPFWLAGTVVSGQKLGRELGFPTANLALTCRQVVPLDGIYAVQAKLEDGRLLDGACSIGNRPTIEGAGRSIETYLLDFNEDIYGQTMEVRFVQRLRGEVKFDSLEALIVQMARDVAQTRALLATFSDPFAHSNSSKEMYHGKL